MRYVKVRRHYAYQTVFPGPRDERGKRLGPDTDKLEVVEPGSVVSMQDEIAERFVAAGMGEWTEGPEHLIRPGKDSHDVERPGLDPRPARAEQAVGRPQRAGAV